MRLIDADVLRELIDGGYVLNFDELPETKRVLLRMIDQQETVEPERKKGKWVWLSSTYDRTPCEMRFWCSECHHETVVHTNGTSEPWEHYCPNCGVEMKGEEDETD